MQSIKFRWGALISEACHLSSVPESFLAALIANESGGKPDSTRYEPAVFKRLQLEHPDWNGQRITDNATSWGLTQIMGINYPGAPMELADPATNLKFAITMLSGFAHHFQLDLGSEFEALFHCWNTGSPVGNTYDPNYTALGIKRMGVYAEV